MKTRIKLQIILKVGIIENRRVIFSVFVFVFCYFSSPVGREKNQLTSKFQMEDLNCNFLGCLEALLGYVSNCLITRHEKEISL